MTPDQIDLARVLVMHPRFRWLAPMAAEDGDRVCPGRDEDPDRGWRRDGTILPDVTDPATAGVLLGMLGRPTTLPAPWICDWHAGVPLGEAVARALLVVWEAA